MRTVCFRRACVICEASSVSSISKYTPTLEAQMKTMAPAPAEHQLTHVADRCEHWRQTHTTSAETLPQYLWQQAIDLTTTLSIHRVATLLRKSRGYWKQR